MFLLGDMWSTGLELGYARLRQQGAIAGKDETEIQRHGALAQPLVGWSVKGLVTSSRRSLRSARLSLRSAENFAYCSCSPSPIKGHPLPFVANCCLRTHYNTFPMHSQKKIVNLKR
jgi:hypothetical protein